MNAENTINYVELPTTNINATKKFYSTVFGWSFTDWGKNYISFSAAESVVNGGVGAGINGGFDATGEAKPTTDGARVVLYSASLETKSEEIIEAGGTISKDIYTFPGGRRFYFLDPSGNELAVWSEK